MSRRIEDGNSVRVDSESAIQNTSSFCLHMQLAKTPRDLVVV